MLTLVLYPYVYMLVRLALSEQSTAILEASRILGKTSWQSLFSVALPMARPAIVAGITLALMETLADYESRIFYVLLPREYLELGMALETCKQLHNCALYYFLYFF